MIRRILYGAFGLLVAGLVVAGIVYLIRGEEAPPPGGGLPVVTAPFQPATSTLPAGETLTIGTSRGSVTVRNFYRDAIEINAERDVLFARTDEYRIVYFGMDSSFLIVIRRTPFNEVRERAERAFLEVLNITQEEACRFTVSLTVPREVDENLAGKSFGLSFCPGGV